MILLLILFIFVVFQLILCCENPRRDVIDYFFISSLTPVPPMTPNPIIFVSPDNLYQELISNNDKFYDTFYDYDWQARKVPSLRNTKNLSDNLSLPLPRLKWKN